MGMLDTLMREALRKAGEQGSKARASKLAPEERSELARRAVETRWARARDQAAAPLPLAEALAKAPPDPGLPVAHAKGFLPILGLSIPCYVISTGQRVLGRTGVTELLTGIEGAGAFEKYIDVKNLKNLISFEEILSRLVEFRIPEFEENDHRMKGVPVDLVLDICRAFVASLELGLRPGGTKLTDRRLQMASRAALVLAACASVGLEALVDEATGYQYERVVEALSIRPRAYLMAELRQWEEIYPDELWTEFTRLTGWKGAERSRAWSRLLCELVYEYLDPALADWLREHRPEARNGQAYHQWLSTHPEPKRLVERLWVLIGLARGCTTMTELRDHVAGMNGKVPVQLRLYLPAGGDSATS